MKRRTSFSTICLIVLVLVLPFGCNASLVSILPEFPIGLSLVYHKDTVYWQGITESWTDTYDVIRWNSTDNSSVIMHNGYERTYPWEYKTLEVSLPSWDYEYYSEDLNCTVSSWMFPLWIEVSNWEVGANISIPAISEHSHVYQVQSEERVEINEEVIRCWVVRTDFVGVNDWDYTYILRYDVQYGILIKVNTVRNPGSDDIDNYATHETVLSASTIMQQLCEPLPESYEFSLRDLLILGIFLEVFVIIFIVGKKQSNSRK